MNSKDDIFEQVEGKPNSDADPEIVAHLNECLGSGLANLCWRSLVEQYKGDVRAAGQHYGRKLLETAPIFDKSYPGIQMNCKMAQAMIDGKLDKELRALLGDM